MNPIFILLGSLEIIFAIILAFLTFLLGFKLLSVFTLAYDDEKEIKNNNIAVGILSAMFLTCIGLSLKEAAGPALVNLKNLILSNDITFKSIIISIGVMLLHLVLTSVISILSLFFSIILATKLSPFKNLKPLANNNIALALIISAAMLVTTLLLTHPLHLFLSGFIPEIQNELPKPELLFF